MPRSTKNLDDEGENKSVSRKSRSLSIQSVVDSPLRRSSRLKPTGRSNESSPESPLSDSSQTSRTTRKRTAAMNPTGIAETGRTLRSRKKSVSPTISESAEDVIGTPRRLRRSFTPAEPSGDTPKATRASKRIMRAGSESKSPPGPTRITRRTRASSMGPEAIGDDKMTMKGQGELSELHAKTQRRKSPLSMEGPVIEEKEEQEKVLVVELRRILPSIEESKEGGTGSADEGKDESSTNNAKLKEPKDTSTTVENAEKNVDGNLTQSVLSNKSEVARNNVDNPVDEATELSNALRDVENDERTVSNVEPQEKVISVEKKNLSETEAQDLNSSNKENQTDSIIITGQSNVENTGSITTLQSLKPFSLSQLANNSKDTVTPTKKKNLTDNDTEVLNKSDLIDNVFIKENTSKKMEKSNKTEELASMEKIDLNKSTLDSNVSENTHKPANVANSKLDESVNQKDRGNRSLLDQGKRTDKEDSSGENVVEEPRKRSVPRIEIIEIEDAAGPEITDANDTEALIVIEPESADPVPANDDSAPEPMDISILEVNSDTNDSFGGDIIVTNASEPMDVSIPEADQIDRAIASSITDPAETNSSNEKVKTTNSSDDTQLHSSFNRSAHEKLQAKDKTVTEAEKSSLEEENNSKNDSVTNDPQSKNITSPNSSTIEKNTSNVETAQSQVDDVKNAQPSIASKPSEELAKETSDENLSSTTPLICNDESMEKCTDNMDTTNEKSESKKSGRTSSVSDIDSDENAIELFKNVSAEQWQKNKTQADASSISSLATERVDNESEAECDLVLVDRDAWLVAQSYKAAKEREMSDYDSDDTLIMKIRIDSLNDPVVKKSNLYTLEEEDEDILSANLPEKKKSLSTSVEGPKNSPSWKSLQEKLKSTEKEKNTPEKEKTMKSKEDHADINKNTKEDICNTKETDDKIGSKMKKSGQKSIASSFLSKSMVIEDVETSGSKSAANQKLNKSDTLITSPGKKQKIEKAAKDINVYRVSRSDSKTESEISNKEANTPSKVDKLLNKSQAEENEHEEIPTELNTSTQTTNKSKSLNTSLTKKVTLQLVQPKSDTETTNSFEDESVLPPSEKKSTIRKSKNKRNSNKIISTISDSSVNSDNDSMNKTMMIPEFLFAAESSDTDKDDDESMDGSIDSDIKREYNLDGDNDLEFEDDDVAGDECRASESEYSDSDDNGSDLADFVVDDEDIRDEDEAEENEEESDADVNANEDDVEEENGEEKDEEEEDDEDEDEDVQAASADDNEENETQGVQDENEDESDEALEVDRDNMENDDENSDVDQEDMEPNDEDDREEKDEEEEDDEDEDEDVQAASADDNEENETEGVQDENGDESDEGLEVDRDNMENDDENSDVDQEDMEPNDEDDREEIENNVEDEANENLNSEEEEQDVAAKRLSTSSIKRKSLEKTLKKQTVFENENIANESIISSSKKKKKKNQIEEIPELVENLKSDHSFSIINRKNPLLNTSVKCSTPKSAIRRGDKLNISLQTPTIHGANKALADEVFSHSFSGKTKNTNVWLKMESSLNKTGKLNDKEKSLYKSLPAELFDCSQKTNLSRHTSSNVTELNKAASTPNAKTFLKQLKKAEKLNTSRGESKQTQGNKQSDVDTLTQLNEISAESEGEKEIEEATHETSSKRLKSVKNEKLENELSDSADANRLKKRRKRKVNTKKIETEIVDENTPEEEMPRIKRKRKHALAAVEDTLQETTDSKNKKRRKKKKTIEFAVDEEECPQIAEITVPTNENEEVNKIKKSKKKDKLQNPDHDVIEKNIVKKSNKIPEKKIKTRKVNLEESEEVSTRLSKKQQKLLNEGRTKVKSSKSSRLIADEDKIPEKKIKTKKVNLEEPQEIAPGLSKKQQKLLNEGRAKVKSSKKSRVTTDVDNVADTIAFAKARDEALETLKRAAEGIKLNKELRKRKRKDYTEEVETSTKSQKSSVKNKGFHSSDIEMREKNLKRLPDAILKYLSDAPIPLPKKRKIVKPKDQILPSRKLSNSGFKASKLRRDNSYIPLSSEGSTTQFGVVDLRRITKQAMVSEAITSYKKKMLARNLRQPTSNYLVHSTKQKASGRDTFRADAL